MIAIQQEVFTSILQNTPLPPPETGGILGMKNGVISEYYADGGLNDHRIDHYTPSTAVLNKILDIWNRQNIQFCGIYHSHYPGDRQLSQGDRRYIERILFQLRDYTDHLLFPLVFPKEEMIFYRAELNHQQLILSQEKIFITNQEVLS